MFSRTPSHRPGTILLAGIALSIGWGIRGNFGHEAGAMMPGALAAIVICLLSGREDWRERVAYFAFFGAIGWGFGGSISYMHSVSYTHSGNGPSQLYGFGANFFIGFLWAGLGGAGMALAATLDRARLSALFKPILFLLAGWVVLLLLTSPIFAGLGKFVAHRTGGDSTLVMDRHEQPLYWLDSDWLSALMALGMVFLYDLWQRREQNGWLVLAFAAAGALLGWGIQALLKVTGLAAPLGNVLTVPLGVPGGMTLKGVQPAADQLITNWPNVFVDSPWHIGWSVGLFLGVVAYFIWYGKFRDGSSFFLHLAAGWLVCFLVVALPGHVLFHDVGGLSLSPPRSDNWAGTLGVFLGAVIWFARNKLQPAAFATLLTGIAGGAAFVSAQLTKLLLLRIGSGYVQVPEAQEALRNASIEAVNARVSDVINAAQAVMDESGWAHYHTGNWHSIYEQTSGLYHGIALALVFAFLAPRLPPPDQTGPASRWSRGFSVFFVLVVLTYLNLMKNVSEWAKSLGWMISVPASDGAAAHEVAPSWSMTPLPEFIAFSPQGWFNLMYLAVAIAFLFLVWRHIRGNISLVPATALGRGQLLFVLLLWILVIGNCERALVGFSEGRLITEATIWFNACLATVLMLSLPKERDTTEVSFSPYRPPWIRLLIGGPLAVCLAVAGVWYTARWAYGDNFAGYAGWQHRMGPYAEWKVNPKVKSQEHP